MRRLLVLVDGKNDKTFDWRALAVDQSGGPEKINHGPAIHPKARLRVLTVNFDRWLSTLEALGQSGLSIGPT